MSGQVTITQLPTAAALTGSESVPVVQNGVTVQTTTGAISGAGALNYPFLTVSSTAGLPQARYLATGTGLSLADNGVGSTLQINMTGAASSLNAAGTGIVVKNSSSTVVNRVLAVGSGMTISNADGIADNPTFGLNTNLQNLASLSGTGLMTINGSTFSQTSILGTTNQISIANGNAVGGSPTLSIADNPILPGTGGVQLPSGSSAQRLGVNGVIRYNTDSSRFEFYQSSAWSNIGTGDGTVTNVQGTANQIAVANGTTAPVISIASNPTLPGNSFVQLPAGATSQRGTPSYGAFRYNSDTGALEVYNNLGWNTVSAGTGVVTFSAGTTGLTPNTPTAGGIVLGGIVNPANGGTGVNNGTNTITVAGNFATAGAYALTLTATGATNVTVPTTGTLATLGGVETLTNKSMSGSSNTFTNIPNSALTNSSVTYNGVTVALGASGTITAVNPYTLTFGTHLTGTSYNGSAAVTIGTDATNANTVSTIVARDASGNFSAGTITATLNGTATQISNALTFGSSLSGTSSTYNGSAAVTVNVANSGVTAGTYGSSAVIPVITVGADGRVTSVSTQATNAPAYQGTWNASTNTPTLTSSVGTAGYYYVVTVAGNTTLNGVSGWNVGDWAIFSNGAWQKIPGSTTESFTNLITTNLQIGGLTGFVYANNTTGYATAATTAQLLSLLGTTPVANGGTGLASYTTGDLLYASGSTTLSKLALGTTNYVLTAGASAPQYVAQSTLSVGSATTATTATNVAGGAAGSLVYQTGAATTSTLALGTTNYVLTAGASAPQYVAQSTLSVGSATNATNIAASAGSGATNYIHFSSSATGNVAVNTNTLLTYNYTNNTLTAGISGGAF